MTTSSSSALPERPVRGLFWAAAVCLLVAWGCQVGVMLTGGHVHWSAWANVLSPSVILVSAAVRPSSPRVASILFFAAAALSLLAIAGIVPLIHQRQG